MEWNKDNLEKFIMLYREQPFLWKIKSNEYKNKNLKNVAYDKLRAFCIENVSPKADKDFVMKKIQGLRSDIRKELRKVSGSTKSGKGAEEVYTPNLWYDSLMLFTSIKNQESLSDSTDNMLNRTQLMRNFTWKDPCLDQIIQIVFKIDSSQFELIKTLRAANREGVSAARKEEVMTIFFKAVE